MGWDFLALWPAIVVVATVSLAIYVAAHAKCSPRVWGRRQLDSEKEFIDTLNDLRIAPGSYAFPISPPKSNGEGYPRNGGYRVAGWLDFRAVRGGDWRPLLWMWLVFLAASTGIAFLAWDAFAGWSGGATVSFLRLFRWCTIAGTLIYGVGAALQGLWFRRVCWGDWLLALILGLTAGFGFAMSHQWGWGFSG